MEAQRSLLHFDPQSQDVVVFVDGRHQFVHILILLGPDLCPTDKTFTRQLVRLVGQAVYVGINAVDNGQTSLLFQIAPLVVSNVPFINVSLLLQPAAFVAQRDGGHAVLQCPPHVGIQYLQYRHLVASHVQMRKHQPVVFNTEVPRTKQTFHVVRHRLTDGISHFLLRLCVGRNGSSYLLTHVQHQLQPPQVAFVARLRPSVEEPEEDQDSHDAAHYSQRPQVQLMYSPLQRFVPAFQFLVLSGVVQDVQIYIPVIVRALLPAQSGIGHTELLTDTRNPFGHGLQFVFHPLLLHRHGITSVEHLQTVQTVVAMVVLPMVVVHIVQRHLQRVQCLLITPVLVQVAPYRDIRTRQLIDIAVSGKLLQGQLPQAQRKKRIHRQAEPLQRMAPLVPEQVIGTSRSHQFSQPLHPCRLKVKEAFPRCRQPSSIQLVKFVQVPLLRRLSVHQSGRSADVVIVQPLTGICRQGCHLRYPSDTFQCLRALLQVIIVNRRHEVELRTGIVQPFPSVSFGKEGVILCDAVHAPQGTDAIIIEFLVHGRALIHPHQANISHQQFQLVPGLFIDRQIQAFRLLVVHLHEGMESQVVAGFSLPRTIEAYSPLRLLRRLIQRIQVPVAKVIASAVQ